MGSSAVFLFALAWAVAQAAPIPGAPPETFRGALAEKGGLRFISLHPRMTLAYDEAGCSLYLAWQGRARRTAEPGKEPVFAAEGEVYHRRVNPSPWSARDAGGPLDVKVRFEGLRPHDGGVELRYSLLLPGGRKVAVTENARFDDHYGDHALFRNFEIKGIPPGVQVALDVTGAGMSESWGGGAVGGLEQRGGRWVLLQDHDGISPIKVTWTAAARLEGWR